MHCFFYYLSSFGSLRFVRADYNHDQKYHCHIKVHIVVVVDNNPVVNFTLFELLVVQGRSSHMENAPIKGSHAVRRFSSNEYRYNMYLSNINQCAPNICSCDIGGHDDDDDDDDDVWLDLRNPGS